MSREGDVWSVVCGDSTEARSELLDVALIEAIRREADVDGDSSTVDYASWTRALADRFEYEAEEIEERPQKQPLPNRGDRIELADRRFGLTIRGTVQHVDRVQILVKLDDGRSRNLRVGIDGFRIVTVDPSVEQG